MKAGIIYISTFFLLTAQDIRADIQTHHWMWLTEEEKKEVVVIAVNYFIGLSTSMANSEERFASMMWMRGVEQKLKKATDAQYSVIGGMAPYLKFMHDWLLEYLLSCKGYDFSRMINRNGLHDVDPIDMVSIN